MFLFEFINKLHVGDESCRKWRLSRGRGHFPNEFCRKCGDAGIFLTKSLGHCRRNGDAGIFLWKSLGNCWRNGDAANFLTKSLGHCRRNGDAGNRNRQEIAGATGTRSISGRKTFWNCRRSGAAFSSVTERLWNCRRSGPQKKPVGGRRGSAPPEQPAGSQSAYRRLAVKWGFWDIIYYNLEISNRIQFIIQ